MLNFITKAPQSRRVLVFGSVMHIWNDLFFALMVPLLPFIKEDLGLSFTEIGLLRSVFHGATAILQIPVGVLAESTGEFWLLVLGNLWVGLGLVAMALSSSFALLLALSFLGGLGGGAQHPLASSMVSRAYDDGGRSTAVGTVNFSGDLGKMIAPLVAGALAISFGWRATLWAVGVASVAFMLVTMLARRSIDTGKPARELVAAVGGSGSSTQMGGFVTLSGVGFLDSATRGAALAFLPFVLVAKDLGPAQVTAMIFFLFLGGAFGKFVVGWLGDRFGTISLIWGTKGLTALLLVLSLVVPPLALAPLMVVLGIGLNGTSSALYAAVAGFVPPHRRARLYGFFYTSNEVGTVLAPILYGIIADVFSLSTAMIVMGLATAAILPGSLTLKRHLEATQMVEPGQTR
ncbi:MAG: MFS transporter [Dehalococcoidia bacterium]